MKIFGIEKYVLRFFIKKKPYVNVTKFKLRLKVLSLIPSGACHLSNMK